MPNPDVLHKTQDQSQPSLPYSQALYPSLRLRLGVFGLQSNCIPPVSTHASAHPFLYLRGFDGTVNREWVCPVRREVLSCGG